jgi:hypothetical protein
MIGVLRAVVTPGATYSQLERGTFVNGPQMLMGTPAGGTQPLFAGVGQFSQQFKGETTQLSTLFTECPLPWGKKLMTGNTDLYLLATDNHGTRQSGSVHQRLRCANNCCMYWTSVSAQQGQVARASAMWAPIWLGPEATDPVVPAGSVDDPPGIVADEYFGLSKVVINGTVVDTINGWTLNTAMDREVVFTDGAIWPKYAFTIGVSPTFRFSLADASIWNTFGTNGTALTELIVYLQRYKPNSAGFYATNQSQHIKFTASSGIIMPDSLSGGPRSRAETQLAVHLVGEDASTDVLTVEVGETIA